MQASRGDAYPGHSSRGENPLYPLTFDRRLVRRLLHDSVQAAQNIKTGSFIWPVPPPSVTRHTQQDDLSNAVQEAVSDYVELRGLNGLCPDVTKWSAPPGPAAFLDAGLPKPAGPGSLPRGLAGRPAHRPARGVSGEEPARGKESLGKLDSIASGSDNSTVVDEDDAGGGNGREARPELRPEGRRKRSSSSSIPSPTWEAEGPEGFISQVRRL